MSQYKSISEDLYEIARLRVSMKLLDTSLCDIPSASCIDRMIEEEYEELVEQRGEQ